MKILVTSLLFIIIRAAKFILKLKWFYTSQIHEMLKNQIRKSTESEVFIEAGTSLYEKLTYL